MSLFWKRETKTPVWRVTVSLGEERREYTGCWITVDEAEQTVDIWLSEAAEAPHVTSPLQATLIEWRPPEGGS